MVDHIQRCVGFGEKFDAESDVCASCESSCECQFEFITERYRISDGVKSTAIVKVDTKTPPPIMVMISRNDPKEKKVRIEIFFDKEWLRKQLGLDKK